MNTTDQMQRIREAADYIRRHLTDTPRIGIVLGTGLGKLGEAIDLETALDYEDIPHFPVSTVESHHGRLLIGRLEGKYVVAMQGRFHYYEGYSLREVTFPIRVMKLLGVETLILSNACGALNPAIKTAELMILDDHINLLPDNPLRGPNFDELGPRFPDMSEPYDRALIRLAEETAQELGIKLHRGTYVVVQGPNLETPAEYRFLRIIGGDVVGMSTVPECIVARHMGMRVMAVSVVTDEGWLPELPEVHLEDVLAAAAQAEPHLTRLLRRVISKIDSA